MPRVDQCADHAPLSSRATGRLLQLPSDLNEVGADKVDAERTIEKKSGPDARVWETPEAHALDAGIYACDRRGRVRIWGLPPDTNDNHASYAPASPRKESSGCARTRSAAGHLSIFVGRYRDL